LSSLARGLEQLAGRQGSHQHRLHLLFGRVVHGGNRVHAAALTRPGPANPRGIGWDGAGGSVTASQSRYENFSRTRLGQHQLFELACGRLAPRYRQHFAPRQDHRVGGGEV
jgi:hypothetical protein